MSIFDILFPKRCVSCGKVGRYICSDCRKTIVPIAPNECICPICGKPAVDGVTHPRCRTRYGMDGLSSFFYYRDAVRRAVQSMKYRLVSDVVNEFLTYVPFGTFFVYGAKGNKDAVVVPVPLYKDRWKQRGFNQAELIAHELSRELELPMRADMLIRNRATPPQVSLTTRTERLKNMTHVFQAVRTIQYRYIILVDDVFTTGATMRAAACALKRAGAKSVWGVTMAR